MVLGTLLMLALDLATFKVPRVLAGGLTCAGALILSLPQFGHRESVLGGLMHVDGFVVVLYALILGGAFLTICLNDGQLAGQRVHSSIDVNVLVLLAAFGAMVMVSALHLLVLFVGFEIMSISVYALSGAARKERSSAEASLKYFVLGALSSAFLLYGMALIYGATASLSYTNISGGLAANPSLMLVGLGLVVFGLGFKVSLVPFHFWAPDVYHGAPTTVSGFMATVVKAAAFGAFLRLMLVAFGDVADIWQSLFWVLSLITMTVGNLAALRQRSVKRMLAYSSVAHAGYALMGFLTIGSGDSIALSGPTATLFYLCAYAVMTLGAFSIVLMVTSGRDEQYGRDDLKSFRGIGWQYPFLGIAMTICLCSLAGMPPLAGFIGKFHLFSAAVRSGFVGLAVIAALNSVLSLYYYLRVLVFMYFVEPVDECADLPGYEAFGSRFALAISVFLTLYLGLNSEWLFNACQFAVIGL
jgi:NADH-quinone oxidoreductase subunit N